MVLAANAQAGLYNEKVLLTTDSPDQPELELRVAAALRDTVTAPGQARASSTPPPSWGPSSPPGCGGPASPA